MATLRNNDLDNSMIYCGVSCNLDKNLLATCLPLWQESSIEAIEWSFDAISEENHLPSWFQELISAYADEGRLIGHGIFFSLFSGRFTKGHKDWLRHLSKVSEKFQFAHFTEHFGFMTGQDFHKGAPMSVPLTNTSLAIGRDRLMRLQNAGQCPIGLENLAFAYSIEYVKEQGDFLERLLEPVNGFIILDLHNVYCQMHNFNCSFNELKTALPLHLVREIHISGGSWDHSYRDQKIRRDTHDDKVPEEVFSLLEEAIPLCHNLKFVLLEQLGTALNYIISQRLFHEDFYRLKSIVRSKANGVKIERNNFLSDGKWDLSSPLESPELYKEQILLSEILETATDLSAAKQKLNSEAQRLVNWNINSWDDKMTYTAMKIAQKWKDGHSKNAI